MQQVTEAAERVGAEGLELTTGPGQVAFPERQHLGGLDGAERAGDLAVGGGEVVVPEERHLLLERALGMDHAKQPALPGVFDDDVRRRRRRGT